MRTFWFTLVFAAPLLAQLDSGSLTVTATRVMVVQPDQAQFRAWVTAGPDSTLDDILARLAPVGLTAANFTAISGDARSLTYTFASTVPIAKITQTAAALNSLGAAFLLTGATVSDDLLAQDRCSRSDLLADAQAQARKMASAIGATAGPPLAVSDAANVIAALSSRVPVATFRTGDFSGGPLSQVIFVPASVTLNCSLIVKFQLK